MLGALNLHPQWDSNIDWCLENCIKFSSDSFWDAHLLCWLHCQGRGGAGIIEHYWIVEDGRTRARARSDWQTSRSPLFQMAGISVFITALLFYEIWIYIGYQIGNESPWWTGVDMTRRLRYLREKNHHRTGKTNSTWRYLLVESRTRRYSRNSRQLMLFQISGRSRIEGVEILLEVLELFRFLVQSSEKVLYSKNIKSSINSVYISNLIGTTGIKTCITVRSKPAKLKAESKASWSSSAVGSLCLMPPTTPQAIEQRTVK